MNEDYISKRQDFSKIFNSDGNTGKTFNSIFQMPEQAKKRKFPGASTKRGHGPVFDPNNPSFKTMNSALTDGGDGGGGDAGGAMGESTDAKFIGLLEALRTGENSDQIDLIRKGFSIIHENMDLSDIDMDLSDLEHPEDIERAFYGEEEEDDIDYEAYAPYVDAILKLIEEHGYWSDIVRNYNKQIPDDIDVGTVHMLAKGKMRNY